MSFEFSKPMRDLFREPKQPVPTEQSNKQKPAGRTILGPGNFSWREDAAKIVIPQAVEPKFRKRKLTLRERLRGEIIVEQ